MKTPVKNKPVRSSYKQTKLGRVPADWEVHRFADVFEFLPTNSFSRDQLTYGGDENTIYNIHYGDIHSTFNDQILDFNKHINQIPVLIDSKIKLSKDAFLQDGDLIIADASEDYEGVGECIEIKNINDRKVISGLHTIAVRDSKGITISGFRAYLLKNQLVSINLKKLATGSKVYGVSKANIANLEILIPPKDIQKRIAKIFSLIDTRVEKTEKVAESLRNQKKGLMQKLLEGKANK